MNDVDTQISALSRAVLATDAGRRVGWGRAFSAEAKADELSRDVNMMRAERDLLYRFASFLYGFTQEYLGGKPEVQHALGTAKENVGAVLDPKIIRAGREAARATHRVQSEQDQRAAMRAEAKAATQSRAKSFQHGTEFGKQRARMLLAKRYGFPNEAALLDYLDQYQGDTRGHRRRR